MLLQSADQRGRQVLPSPWSWTGRTPSDKGGPTRRRLLDSERLKAHGIEAKNTWTRCGYSREVASDLSAVGFMTRTQQDLMDLAEFAAEHGRSITASLGRYVVWPSESGEQLWLQINREGRLVGLNPHFVGPSRIRVGIVEMMRDQSQLMEGCLSCWADPRNDDPESGTYPLVVDLPDFDTSTLGMELPRIATLQVAAFARDLRCWPDDAAYELAEFEQGEPRRPPSRVRGFAVESFIPSGMFGMTEGQTGPTSSRAIAIFTGHVLSANLRTNGYSRKSYWSIHTQTLGGQYDVVADPEVVGDPPLTGGVIQGTFWLTARLIGAP